jgi:transposase
MTSTAFTFRLNGLPDLIARSCFYCLSDLFILRGVPEHIRSDHGPEFIAKEFNARLRDELLNGEIFYSLNEARIVIESWRRHYNTLRPHSGMDYSGRCEDRLHRAGQPVGERLCRIIPVRFVDAFVAELDLTALGFARVTPKATGRPGYAPSDLLRLYIYGYLNRVRSSRRLEAECHRNIEVIWLLRTLRPDFKTIADFRNDNRAAFKKVFREFVILCRRLDLFGRELLAVDGTRIKAVNNKDRNFTKGSLQKFIAAADKELEDYLNRLDVSDTQERLIFGSRVKNLRKRSRRSKRSAVNMPPVFPRWKRAAKARFHSPIPPAAPWRRIRKLALATMHKSRSMPNTR